MPETVTSPKEELAGVARLLVANGKGILAADESPSTLEKRFKAINVESSVENRRKYRELLFQTPNLGNFISGVILHPETLEQSTSSGIPFPHLLRSNGMLVGVKVDLGTTPIPNTLNELSTQGLDGLEKRCNGFRLLGARFAKWRCVIRIDASKDCPSSLAIRTVATNLSQYAAISQSCGLVPIVEPEILMDGNHSLETCERITEETLTAVFYGLHKHQVQLEGILLKPNMVTAGAEFPGEQADSSEVAKATLRALYRCVPPAVPGVVFLSGGQSEQEATHNLNLINQQSAAPWRLSFSFGRALQHSVLSSWSGKEENVFAAQKELLQRAEVNSRATLGTSSEQLSSTAASLYTKEYSY